METDRLKHFRVLVETGNMRRAAELLHISHGGLSKSIKKLEEELRVSLIQPEGRGIAVTDEGKRVYAKALDLLKSTEGFLEGVRKDGDARPTFIRIGTFEVFSTYFIGAALEAEPGFSLLQVREYLPGKLEAAVRSSEVDYGVTYLPIPHPELVFSKILSIEMGIYVAKGAFGKVPLEELPFVAPIAPVEGSPTGVKGLDGWPEHVFSRKIAFEVDLMETGLSLCRRGACAIFIPTFIAALHNEVVTPKFFLQRRPYPKGISPVHRDVYLITRKGQSDSIASRKIAKSLRAICKRNES